MNRSMGPLLVVLGLVVVAAVFGISLFFDDDGATHPNQGAQNTAAPTETQGPTEDPAEHPATEPTRTATEATTRTDALTKAISGSVPLVICSTKRRRVAAASMAVWFMAA